MVSPQYAGSGKDMAQPGRSNIGNTPQYNCVTCER
jgi:hypothetical protein